MVIEPRARAQKEKSLIVRFGMKKTDLSASDIKQWITKYILEQFDKMVIFISPKMMSEMSIHGIIVSWQRKTIEYY